MDYVVGSVAALITGNVTPNRPKLLKRALTPTKHQPSPNVTPKSEFVEDRSIFLSPTMQKKKAIVKKSPKRIFQNPDLENTDSNDGNLSVTSPKADKVKKHLKEELEGDDNANKSVTSQKSPKKKGKNKRESTAEENNKSASDPDMTETTPKKKKKKENLEIETTVNVQPAFKVSTKPAAALAKSSKNMKQRRKSVADTDNNKENDTSDKVPEIATNNNKSPNNQKNKANESAKQQPAEVETGNSKSAKKKNKRRKKKSNASVTVENVDEKQVSDEAGNKENIVTENKMPKKKNRKRKKSKGPQNKPDIIDTKKPNIVETQNTNKESDSDGSDDEIQSENEQINKKSKLATATENNDTRQVSEEIDKASKKKNKKRKKSKGPQNRPEIMDTDEPPVETQNDIESETNIVNPNAITEKESDSEHESDDEIESENEEINKKVLEAEKPEESSDEEDEEEQKIEKKKVEKKEDSRVERNTEEETQRTLFVGNVPFTPKCKKEIKKIFSKHGQIETIRIRTVPIKDGSYTPKLALIKNELHPERTTVNVYIKYAQPDSVEKALVENNTVLNEHHLRVSRSSSTGAEHDPRCSVFIGNLPFAIEDETLRAKFEKCGEIHSVRIIRDKKTNAGKGFGYVNFESKDSVELALALKEEDLTIKNRILRVKRAIEITNRKKKPPRNIQQSGGFRGNNNQGSQQRGGFRRYNNEGSHQRGHFRNDNQGNQQRGGFRNNNYEGGHQRGGFRNDNNQDGQQRGGFRDNNQVKQQRSGFSSRNNQGNRQRNAFGNNQNQQSGGFNKFGNQRNQSQKDDEGREGAHRRVMNKRKYQDGAGGDGPPSKIQKDDQPNKEKKSRKEFVGMTAEKKKKHKFDKGQKKKKALSEILTK